MLPGGSATISGTPAPCRASVTGSMDGATDTANGAARLAAVNAAFSLSANSMAASQGRGDLPGPADRLVASADAGGALRFGKRADLRVGDGLRRLHLHHQVVAPVALDLEVGGGATLDGRDKAMVYVGIAAGLPEAVQACACRPAANEPGFQIGLRTIRKLAGLPPVVAMPADEVRTRVTIGLRVHDQHGLADLCRQGVLAGERADLAVEHD